MAQAKLIALAGALLLSAAPLAMAAGAMGAGDSSGGSGTTAPGTMAPGSSSPGGNTPGTMGTSPGGTTAPPETRTVPGRHGGSMSDGKSKAGMSDDKMTNNQVRMMLEKQGYTDVHDVKAAPSGHTATASKNGKTVHLKVDGAGNVTPE